MFTSKTRTLIVTLLAAIAVAAVPATSHAVRATPTGNQAQDDYCNKVAALINHAMAQGDRAIADGDVDNATAWYALATQMQQRSARNGCMWVNTRRINRVRLELADLGPVKIPPRIKSQVTMPRPPLVTAQDTAPIEPGTTQGDSGTSTGTHSPEVDAPTVSGPMG